MVLPNFISGANLANLQQHLLPGNVIYEQPRRCTVRADGERVVHHQHYKEAWFCHGYDYADPKRVQPPYQYRRNALQPWAVSLLDQTSRASLIPFNSFMSRW